MLQKIADAVRVISAEAVEKTGSGHPGMPMGCAEIGAYLFSDVLKYDPQQPEWFNRDRLFLSAGHGSMWLYAMLHLSGYELSMDDLKEYRKFNSKTPSHPEYGRTPGVEMTTGPLGQGFAHAVGAAVAEEVLAEKYNQGNYKLIDHYTYVMASDGDLMEGISYEAASLAGTLNLGKLIVIYDNNHVSIDGPTDLSFQDNIRKRFESAGWHVVDEIDGSSFNDLEYAFNKAKSESDRPSIIIADTVIGKGAPNYEGKRSAHASPLGREEIERLKESIGWDEEEFSVPDEVYQYFEEKNNDKAEEYAEWTAMRDQYKDEFSNLYQELEQGINLEVGEHLKEFEIMFKSNKAPRDYSGEYFRYFADQLSYLISGSADLTSSTRLKLNKYRDINGGNFSGRSIKFGVREHAMAAAASGIILHQGLRSAVSTYLTFSDYMRPSIRLAAMMSLPVIYVFTHDSIYVGEDGPTHQPVEQIEALRLIPNLRVIRPADEKEVRFAWRSILAEKNRPVAFILARQTLAELENEEITFEEFEKGAYILKDYEQFLENDQRVDQKEPSQKEKKKKVVLLASGSEVSLALDTAELIREKADSKIISVPERGKLEEDEEFFSQLIEESDLVVALEAGVKTGWYRLLSKDGLVIGVEDFGISGSGEELAHHFGLEADKIAEKILNKI